MFSELFHLREVIKFHGITEVLLSWVSSLGLENWWFLCSHCLLKDLCCSMVWYLVWISLPVSASFILPVLMKTVQTVNFLRFAVSQHFILLFCHLGICITSTVMFIRVLFCCPRKWFIYTETSSGRKFSRILLEKRFEDVFKNRHFS